MRFHRRPIGFHSNPANLSDSPNPWSRHEPRLHLPMRPVGSAKARGCIFKRRGWISRVLRLDFVGTSILFAELTSGAEQVLSRPRPYGTRCRSPTERHAVPTERGAVPYGTTFRTLRNEVPCNTEEKPEDNIGIEHGRKRRGFEPEKMQVEWQEKP